MFVCILMHLTDYTFLFQWYEILFSSHKLIFWIHLSSAVALVFSTGGNPLVSVLNTTERVTYIPAVILLNLCMAFNFGLTLACLSFLTFPFFPIAHENVYERNREWRCVSSYIFLNKHKLSGITSHLDYNLSGLTQPWPF